MRRRPRHPLLPGSLLTETEPVPPHHEASLIRAARESGDARGERLVDELGDARYVSLTTYKRDGTPVATPVWIARSEDGYVFTSGTETWKARRLRRDPRVQVQACGARGRVTPGAAVYTGTGVVKDDAASVAAAESAIHAKYGWQFRITRVVERAQRALHLGTPQAGAAIELSLRPAD